MDITVDSGPPDEPTITLDPDGWTKAAEVKVTVDHEVSDEALSDIETIRVKIGDAAWQDYDYDELPIQTNVTEEGQTVIQAQAVDVIGNTSPIVYRTVKISRTGLRLESQLFHTADHKQLYISENWTNQSVTADVYVSHDQGVSIDSVTYSTDEGATWLPYDAPLDFSTEGEHSLWVQAKDAAGNDMTERLIIKIDQTNPLIQYGPDGNTSPSQSVSAQVVVIDEDSGIDEDQLHYIWSKSKDKLDETADWKPFDHLSPLNLAGEVGEWYLHIRALDQAGNESYAISQRFSLESSSQGGNNSGHWIPARSNNAKLGKLVLSEGQLTPAFAADVTEYNGEVANEIDHIHLIVSAAHRLAVVTIHGERIDDQETVSILLDEGTNTIEISVTAEDGTENTYTLIIDRMKAKEKEKAPSDEPTLTDISGHWAEAFIDEAWGKGLIQGYPDGTFKPNQPVTRAEFTVMLTNALNLEGEGVTLAFADRDQIGGWAERAIALAVEAGIVSGYEDGTFRPDLPMTRAEMKDRDHQRT